MGTTQPRSRWTIITHRFVTSACALRHSVTKGENTKAGYIYKTSFNGVATPTLGLDKLFPGSQVNGGILIAVLIAIGVYVLMTKTTMGYQLKACGSNRHAARYAGINDKRNIVLSMAIAGCLAGGGAALYWLSGNTGTGLPWKLEPEPTLVTMLMRAVVRSA